MSVHAKPQVMSEAAQSETRPKQKATAGRESISGKPVDKKRQVRDRAATSAMILDVAERIFAQQGLRGTRTEDIAAGSGVTKAMIHYYFGTKESLYQAVLHRVFRERIEGMDLKSLEQMPALTALRSFAERMLEQMCRKPHLGSLFALENAQNAGAYYTRGGGDVYRVLSEIVARGVADGTFRPIDPWHTAINVMGACIHYFNVASNVRRLWPSGRNPRRRLMLQHSALAIDFVMAAVCVPAAGASRVTLPNATNTSGRVRLSRGREAASASPRLRRQ
jgi:TetR/AcrR family transcriptional regulator